MTLAVLSFATRKTPGRVMLRCDDLALDEARDLEPSPPFARWTGAYESGYWTREALLGIGLAIGTWLEGPQRWLSRLAQATAPVILVIETTRTPDPIEQAALDAPWELIACATSEREGRAFAPPQGDESVPAPVEELLQQLGPVDWQNVHHLAFEPSVLLSVVRRLGKSAAPLEPSKYRLSVVFMPCQPDGSAGISVDQERAILKATDGLEMHLEVEDSGSLHGLGDLIAQLGDYDVLQVSCPAMLAPSPALAFEGARGERVDVSADDIWNQIGSMPRLAVVSAYGEAAPGSAFTSRWAQNASAVAVASGVLGPLSMQLCQRGWPAVIGLAGTTAAQAEIDFVAALYRLLSQRTSLLDAFARALRAIDDAAAGTLWHRVRLVLGPRGGGPVVEGADVHPGLSHLNQSRQFLDPNGQIPIATDYQTSLHRRALQSVVAMLRNAAFPAVAVHGSDERSRATFVSRVLRCMRPMLRRVVLTANFDAPAIVRTIRDQTAHSEIADLVKKSQGKLREDPSQLQHVLRAIVEGPCRDGGSGAFVLVLHDFDPAPGSDDLVVLRALLGAFAGANTASRLLITCRVRFPAIDEEGIDISQRLAWQSLAGDVAVSDITSRTPPRPIGQTADDHVTSRLLWKRQILLAGLGLAVAGFAVVLAVSEPRAADTDPPDMARFEPADIHMDADAVLLDTKEAPHTSNAAQVQDAKVERHGGSYRKDRVAYSKTTELPVSLRNMRRLGENIDTELTRIEAGISSGEISSPNHDIIFARINLIGYYGYGQRGGSEDCEACKNHPAFPGLRDNYRRLDLRMRALEVKYNECTYGYQMSNGDILEPTFDWSPEEWASIRTKAKHGVSRCWLMSDPTHEYSD